MSFEPSKFSLYRALIKPLRDNDGTELLKRFLLGPQAQFERVESEVLGLLDQISPDAARSDVLKYLKDIVGFTNDLRSITDRLDERQLRRLIQLAVPMWKERHTPKGIINAIRLLTGRNAYLIDWFRYRMLLGEVMLTEDVYGDSIWVGQQHPLDGEPWIIGGTGGTFDEYSSSIRVMDDGTLDELLLLDIARLMRPINERFEIFLDDFLDQFETGLDRWTNTGTVQIFGNRLSIRDAAIAQPIIPILANDAAHTNYNIAAKFNIKPASDFITQFYKIGTNYYQLTISLGGQLLLQRYVSGVPTTIFNDNVAAYLSGGFSITQNTYYKLRIRVSTLAGNNRSIRVLIDSNQVIPRPDSGQSELIDNVGGSILTSGPYRFTVSAGADDEVALDNVESWRDPGRCATIGLSTAAEPGGAVVKTSNFVQ